MTDSSRTADTRALLRAGALLPLDVSIEPDEPADTIGARSYSHPALGERPVLRLTPNSIASAEDLALEFLGFQLDQVAGPIGRGRLQALGFPGWVLVHDPQNGAYALAVVKEMERLSRSARSRPGSTRDGFEAIAQRLSRSTPHFLPTFYEQAGRAFIAAGNLSYAASMFARGREAERVYNLAIDEQRRQQVFLEFALAGALTAKALQEYAEELARTYDPVPAYAIFRDLCLQRTLGGVPPWTGMPQQLKRMAQAAGLNPAEEEALLLEQLLEAPATTNAPDGFWKACRATLLQLARRSPTVRGMLLNLFPRPQRGAEGFDDWWLDLLDGCGALEALCNESEAVPPEADVRGSPAAWLSKMATHGRRGWWTHERVNGLHALLPRMAGRLRADGEPVDLIGPRGWGADLDLIDLALSLDVPLAHPAPEVQLDLRSWARQPPASRRPLEHLNADPTHGILLRVAVDAYLERSRADDLIDASGVREALKAWVARRADVMEIGGLVQVDDVLRQLSRAASPRSLALNPDARARILAADVGGALARTLRGGLLDELGWPALEEARAKLHPGRQGLRLSPSWPNLILSDGARAIVVGPGGCLLEHDLRIPTQRIYGLPYFLYIGGQLLVGWSGPDGWKAYWSGRPSEIFDPPSGNVEMNGGLGFSWELPDGGRTAGARAVHPGDTNLPESAHMLSDGTRFWKLANGKLREYDPASGQLGRTSLPPFLDDFAGEGYSVQIDRSWLMPLPPQIARTPLGMRDGLIGWRLRRASASATYEGESIDGRTFSGPLDGPMHERLRQNAGPVPIGLVELPGDEGPERGRPLSLSVQDISLWDTDGRRELGRYRVGAARPQHARGTPLVVPAMFWHCLQPRDPAGSRALRRLSDDDAQRLLRSAREEIQNENLPATRNLLRRLLPDVTHPELVTGVLGAVRLAASLVPRLQVLEANDVEEVTTTRHALDGELIKGLAGLEVRGVRVSGIVGPTTAISEQIEMVAGYMAASLRTSRFSLRRKDPMPKSLPASPLQWEQFIGRAGAIAYRAASPGTAAGQREALLTLLELWAETPFAEHPEWFRVAEVTGNHQQLYEPAALRRIGGRHYYLGPAGYDYRQRRSVRTIVEGSSSGQFELPGDFQLVGERAGPSRWDSPDRIRHFVELARQRGPMPWHPEAVDELSGRTGLTRAEAALLLAGLPNLDTYTHNFLPKELREMLGLKVAEAAVARQSLAALTPQQRIDLLDAAMPLDPAQLWEPRNPANQDSPVERMATAWIAALGRRISVPDHLLGRVKSTLPTMSTPLQVILAAFAQPATDPRLNQDAVWSINSEGQLGRQGTDPAFDGDMLTALFFLIPWLFSSLPVGDPLRAMIPDVLERARGRLSNWNLLVGGDWMAAEIQGKNVLDLLPGEPYRPPSAKPLPRSRDAGFLVATVPRDGFTRVYLRPAAVTGDEQQALLQLLTVGRAPYVATSFLKGPGATGMAARVVETPVPAGGWEANPLLSAPHLVQEAASSLQLEEDAAALYLQILTLPDPTTRNLCTWNGWSAKRLGTAADTLVARDLLVRAKRPRAGRDIFLPGPWEDLRAPDLPVESWKLPLYAHATVRRMLALKPLHQLFDDAWGRVRSGDAPAFESVPQGRRR